MNTELIDTLRASPALDPLRRALSETPAYLVGGAVRDALLGDRRGDLDIAIEGELGPLLDRLGSEARTHERFGTASLDLDGLTIDLARTRRERYPHPGALPEVEPAPIRSDLARRDFTVNAIAVPLGGELELIDPYDGVADLEAGLLRVIHDGSLADDPTRALRAARYSARLGFRLERVTEELVRAADLSTVSSDRVAAELARIGEEREAVAAFELLAGWGLLELDPERRRCVAAAAEIAQTEPWSKLVRRSALLVAVAIGDAARLREARALADLEPRSPSAGFETARRHDDLTLAIARAMGAEWLDAHVSEWRRVELAIDGAELISAGVPEGPAVGRGLRAALHGRLDGTLEADRDAELAAALAAAREPA
jgi:tRNA nucleotidyltransferase (CCA-adding enzyme)